MFLFRLYVWSANELPPTKINDSPLQCYNINTHFPVLIEQLNALSSALSHLPTQQGNTELLQFLFRILFAFLSARSQCYCHWVINSPTAFSCLDCSVNKVRVRLIKSENENLVSLWPSSWFPNPGSGRFWFLPHLTPVSTSALESVCPCSENPDQGSPSLCLHHDLILTRRATQIHNFLFQTSLH